METITATERPQDRTGAGTSTRAYGSIVPSDPVDVVYIARLRDCQEQKAYMQSSHIAPQLWAGDKPKRALAGCSRPTLPATGEGSPRRSRLRAEEVGEVFLGRDEAGGDAELVGLMAEGVHLRPVLLEPVGVEIGAH